jgi:hypothetical protein
MKARIFLDYHRYYQELKGNAIKSKYPTQKKEEGEVKSSFDTFCISQFHNPSTLPSNICFSASVQKLSSSSHSPHKSEF